MKVNELEDGKLFLYLKYYDKTNKENDIQMIDDTVSFDKKTGEISEFLFLNSINDNAFGYIEWKNEAMYITIKDASNSNMICKDIELYEQGEEDFMNSIGSEHDIDLSFQ